MITRSQLPSYRTPAVVGGVVLAGASLMAYLIGTYLHQGPPPGCDQYVYCPSERDRWAAETREWFLGACLVGLLVAWSALVWRPISTSASLRRVLSVVALIGCVPVTGLLWVVTLLIAGNTCEPGSFLCFSGNDALWVAVPAAVASIVSLLLAVSLASRDDQRVGRVCGTLALTFVSGVLVLVAAGFVLGGL